MILEILENVRTLRGEGANRKYRYTRRVRLQCDTCGFIWEVNLTQRIKNKDTHDCHKCRAIKAGIEKRGKYSNPNKGKMLSKEQIQIGSTYTDAHGYTLVYVGRALDKSGKSRAKYTQLHRLVAETKLGRKLEKHELVHHINGDKQDNRPDNLYVCSSIGHHRDIHTQLEKVTMQLVQAGIIQFNHETAQYTMPDQEEIFDLYSVNSEDTYSLVIPKGNDLDKAILSQAEQYSEGATTIPLGSRAQESSKRGES
jgi:hypothetical protein